MSKPFSGSFVDAHSAESLFHPDLGAGLSAIDGDVSGGKGSDKFRIKIWDKVTGDLVYDNEAGAADDAVASTLIEAGKITIHK